VGGRGNTSTRPGETIAGEGVILPTFSIFVVGIDIYYILFYVLSFKEKR